MHKPVMLNEVFENLNLTAPLNTQAKNAMPSMRKRIVDATVGTGGYSLKFCELGIRVLGIEQDPEMIEIAKSRINRDCPSFKLVRGNFADIFNIATREEFTNVDGIVYDLGVSLEQLTSKSRGLSFSNPKADLDMRLDPQNQKVAAKDLLNALNKGALLTLFKITCEEYEARKLVRRILESRVHKPFNTVGDLLDATRGVIRSKPGINPATKVFHALRIAVNSEIENLTKSLRDAVKLLRQGGRLVVVSFHSTEDSLVKNLFRQFQSDGLGKVLTKKPTVASDSEVNENVSSRSAKLRTFEKI